MPLPLEWRSVPGQATDHVLNLVNEAVADLKVTDPDFNCEVRAARADESFETAAESALVKFLSDASDRVPATIAFGTEAPSMIALGAEAVVFGPGDIRVAHRTGEFVPVDELHRCVAILSQAIQHFCH